MKGSELDKLFDMLGIEPQSEVEQLKADLKSARAEAASRIVTWQVISALLALILFFTWIEIREEKRHIEKLHALIGEFQGSARDWNGIVDDLEEAEAEYQEKEEREYERE